MTEPEFKMPRVFVGMTVLIRTVPDDPKTFMGFVFAAGERSIEVGYYVLAGDTVRPRLGTHVRHIDDPDLKNPDVIRNMVDDRDSGVWEYTAETLARDAMVEGLKDRIKSLEDGVAQLTAGDEEDAEHEGEEKPSVTRPKARGKKELVTSE